jgi:dienelactone hydrolase
MRAAARVAAVAGRADLLTRVAALLDRAALVGMRLAFDRALEPAIPAGTSLAESARPYLDPTLQAHPRRFFAFLDRAIEPESSRVVDERRVPGGRIRTFELATLYVPWCGSRGWSCGPENARLPVVRWEHDDGARATVIAVHGFTMGRPDIDARVLMAAQWFARGFDVALPVLPFHGPRAAPTARYSGEAFGSWDVRRLNEAVRQSVHDVELVRRWLAAERDAPIGLVGLSLGGYVTALMAELCPDVSFAVPVAAPVTLASLPQRLFAARAPSAPLPIDAELLTRAYRVHSPLTHALAVARERVLVVGGRGDAVVPPDDVRALWRHWGRPALHWYGGSHTTPFGRGRVLARIDAHLRWLERAAPIRDAREHILQRA